MRESYWERCKEEVELVFSCNEYYNLYCPKTCHYAIQEDAKKLNNNKELISSEEIRRQRRSALLDEKLGMWY